MDDTRQAEDLVKRLAAAIRARALYAATHPIVNRTVDSLSGAFDVQFRQAPSLSMGFLGDDVIVGRTRLKNSAALSGLVRQFRDQQVEKITFSREMGKESLRNFVSVVAERDTRPLPERLAAAGIRGVGVGVIATDEPEPADIGVMAAKQVYNVAVNAAQALWGSAEAGEEPDPKAAREIIDTLAKAVGQDRTSMIALTSLKGHDAYTFTHMVNVSLLTMAQARALGISGPMLREFGLAGLMHDVGKVKTPKEVLTKPDRLTNEEMTIMKRHVIDGAQILRRTPEMPALASVVAFEHHLKQDLSGYPEHIGTRELNLCTMLVSISDVFDALRTKRVYRDGLPADRVRAMLAEQSGTAFQPTLLRRFISLMGLFPVGTLVRLKAGHVAVVTAEHAADPFRPQVKVVLDSRGARVEHPWLVNTVDRGADGQYPYAVLEAVNGSDYGLDPLALMAS
jgi:putative nucleotidyltransferase with HDIG domain